MICRNAPKWREWKRAFHASEATAGREQEIRLEGFGVEGRDETRSNVLLAAVLNNGTEVVPVRIRNLSPHGALLDSLKLPSLGRIVLRRGHLTVAGEVAWVGNGQCGVRFSQPIDVAEWVKRVAHSGQQRVDSIVAALKAGTLPYASSEPELPDLHDIAQQLEEVNARLSMLPDMTTELAEQLVRLEALAKAIQQCAAALNRGGTSRLRP